MAAPTPNHAPKLLGLPDSLSTRLALFSFLLIGLFSALLSMGIYRAFEDDRATAMERLHSHRLAAERQLENYIANLRFKMSELERLIDQSDLDSPALLAACTQFLRMHPELINVAVADREGTLRFSTAFPVTNPPQNYRSLPDAPQIFAANSFYISTAAAGPTTGRWGCVASQPLTRHAGMVLAVPIDLQKLSSQLYFGPDSTGLIVTVGDRNLRLVLTSHEPSRYIGALRPAGAHVRTELSAGRNTGTFVGVDGTHRTYDATILPAANWLISVAVPTDEIYADAREKLLRAMLVVAFVILVATISGRLFSRALTRPVVALAATARAHASGQSHPLAPITGPSEIAETAQAFNDMVLARQRAEQSLIESELRYRTIVEQTRQIVYDVDLSSERVQWFGDRAIPEITGESVEEFSHVDGAAWAARIHPEDRTGVIATYKRCFSTGAPFAAEYRFRHQDGTYRVIEDRGVILRDASGKPKRMLGRMSDITEQSRVLHETTTRQRLLREIIDLVPHFIFAKDRAGRFLLANVSIARAHGLTPEQMIGRTDAEIHANGADVEAFLAADRAVFDTGQPVTIFDESHTTIDGRVLTFNTIKIPFDFPGPQGEDIPTVLGVAADITELKAAHVAREQIEKKLLETQKLESLGVLAGGIAHDFNNLLTGVLGNAGLAGLTLPEDSPTQRHIKQIELAAHRAADLCRQMLAYSGRGRFVVQTIDLNELVRETLELLTVSISKKAQLRFEPTSPLPPIQADAAQLRQVVMNLVINASESLEERPGQVTISTGVMTVDTAFLASAQVSGELAPGEVVFLEVRDTGIGMSPTTLTRIFDPFYTTKFTGRGLGLAAVLGIVRGHKGAIKVQSSPGQGTTFRVLFPATTGRAQPLHRPQSASLSWRGQGHALIVDDEESIRILTQQILTLLGLTADTAHDGAAALDLFRAQPERFDVVLLDLTMPNVDGEETFRQLRLIQPDVKVILMSGYNRAEAVSRFVGKGLAGFIQKPFQVDTLTAELRRVLPSSQ